MKSTYKELELALKEQRVELTDSYDYCEMIQEMYHASNMKNTQLELLVHSLNKQIIKGYIN